LEGRFIPTVQKPTMPGWLPKTRLYVGLDRFGLGSGLITSN
jgi:hypothetical protein